MEVENAMPRTAVIGRFLAGWLIGYMVSMISSILLFLVTGVAPHRPVSTVVIVGTALYGMFFAALAAVVGASFLRRQALSIGASIALTIAGVAAWSWWETPGDAHWSQAVAILLMAPAAQFGALFRRSSD